MHDHNAKEKLCRAIFQACLQIRTVKTLSYLLKLKKNYRKIFANALFSILKQQQKIQF